MNYLSKKDEEIFFKILDNFRHQFIFYLFGSRAKGTHKQYSDLDLALVRKQNGLSLSPIRETFIESNLSITVDLVDYEQISPDFRAIIDFDKIQI